MEENTSPQSERALVKGALVTASPPENTLSPLDLPRDLRGKTILDIGAGGSTAVLELQKRGARAIAVDFHYSSIQTLKEKMAESITRSLADPDRVAEASNELAGWDETLRLNAQDIKLGAAEELQTIGNFFNALRRSHRLQAVAALAGYLPFKDNSVDICYSNLGILPALEKDKDVLIGSIAEGLRVLKPGGNFQIAPWGGPNLDNSARENQETLLKYLEESDVAYRIEDLGLPVSRLRIIKPKEHRSISSFFNRLKSLVSSPKKP